MACDEFEALIAEYFDGRPGPERRRVEEHLARCPECRHFWELQRALDESLAALAPPVAPVGFRGRVLHRSLATPQPEKVSWAPELLDLAAVGGVAAAGAYALYRLAVAGTLVLDATAALWIGSAAAALCAAAGLWIAWRSELG